MQRTDQMALNESLRSLRWEWIGFGWFIAVAITSLILLGYEAFDLLPPEEEGDALWFAIALVVGFFVTGLFVGTRVVAAPVLHGLAMAALSLVAWFAANLFFGVPLGQTTWGSLEFPLIVGLLVLQTAAAAVGARIGVRLMRTVPEET